MDWLLLVQVRGQPHHVRVRNCAARRTSCWYAQLLAWLRFGAPAGVLWREVVVTDCVRVTAGSFQSPY